MIVLCLAHFETWFTKIYPPVLKGFYDSECVKKLGGENKKKSHNKKITPLALEDYLGQNNALDSEF